MRAAPPDFSPNNEVAASLAQATIFEALNTWLGTVITVDDLKVLARQQRRYLNLEVTA